MLVHGALNWGRDREDRLGPRQQSGNRAAQDDLQRDVYQPRAGCSTKAVSRPRCHRRTSRRRHSAAGHQADGPPAGAGVIPAVDGL
jgi:hypothetical protein